MISLPKLIDQYSLRARIYPALIALAPVLALIAILLPWQNFTISQAAAGVFAGGALFALSAFSRRMGKRLESKLYARWGGKPSLAVLRHKDSTFDEYSKARYHQFLSSQIGIPAPTPSEEEQNLQRADAFYESAGNWIRENVRNQNDLRLIYEENIHYGFWRNLLGLKYLALFMTTICAVAEVAMLVCLQQNALFDDSVLPWVLVLGISFSQALFMSFAVKESVVKEAAYQYARQLILSCETLVALSAEGASKNQRVDRVAQVTAVK